MPAAAISLLDGKLSFTLPAGMADQSGKLGTQANNMHVYSDATGQKAVIVIVGDSTNEDLAVLAKRPGRSAAQPRPAAAGGEQ